MRLILDASVATSWLLEDAGAGQTYANAVFDALASEGAEARVPATRGLEIANVIAKSKARGILSIECSQAFLAAIAAVPIVCDAETYAMTLTRTLELARRYCLSAYDASYLELATRTSLPLATLDAKLQDSATQANVTLFAPT